MNSQKNDVYKMKKKDHRTIDPKTAVLSETLYSSAGASGSVPRAQFMLVGGGILLTMLPVTMIVPVLKELVSVRYGVDTFWAHVFMSASLAGAIIFAPLAGIIIDRTASRRKVIFFALLGDGICFLAMAVAPSFSILMLARFSEGAMHITALSAWLAAGADLSPGGRSGRIMGALGGMLMLGISIGVPLGGVIAKTDSLRVLWAAAFISAVTAVFALSLVNRQHQNGAPAGLQEFVRVLRQNPWLALPYVYTFIDRLCIGVVVSTFTLYMTDVLRLNPAQRGMELAFFLLPFALLSYFVGRLSDRIGRAGLMAAGSLLFGFVFMSYGYLSGAGLSAAMILSGILSAVMFAPNLAMCKDLSAEENRGTAFAGYNVAGSLGFVIGPLLGGGIFAGLKFLRPILEAYRLTFIISGSFEVLCALISLPFLIKLVRSDKSR
jgi:MFS family permease